MYKNIDTFDLYPYDENIEKNRNDFLYNLLSLSYKLDKLDKFKNCQAVISENNDDDYNQVVNDAKLVIDEVNSYNNNYVNIKDIIDKFNRIMKILSNLFNRYVDSLNHLDMLSISSEIGLGSLPKFNLKYVTYEPIKLKSYDVLISRELIDFLNNLKNRTSNLYKKINSIPNLIPNLKSISEIDKEIEVI